MSRHLFFVPRLLFFLMFCACGPASAGRPAPRENAVELSVPMKTKMVQGVGDKPRVVGVEFLGSPFLVGGDGGMILFAEVYYTANGRQSVDIVTRHIRTEGKDWVKRLTEHNGSNWMTQWALRRMGKKGYFYELGSSFAVVLNKKIYLLVVTSRQKNGAWGESDREWNFELVVGEIKSWDCGNETIHWYAAELPLFILTKLFKKHSLRVLPHGGFTFLTEEGKIVFFMGTTKRNRSGIATIYLKDTWSRRELTWSYVEVAGDCYSFSFFRWGGKIIMVPAYCRHGGRNVKESADLGKTWTDVVGAESRVWDNLEGKRDFTTATIENKTVLLFTFSGNAGTKEEPRYEIRLLFTEGSRVHDVGPIVSDVNISISGGLLYTSGELFFLHQKWDKGLSDILFTHLKDELKNIKSVLNTWAEKNAYLSRPCNETYRRGAPSGTRCVTPMPTDGLVGFLSNTSNDSHWRDEYLYVDAVVKGGTKVKNGFMFSGVGAGAKWPVGQQWESKRYDFTRHGLTVVATVVFYGVLLTESPLLTVGGAEGGERLGLWYGRDKQWKVVLNDLNVVHAGRWETNRAYKVVLVLRNNFLSAYVDGKPVGEQLQISTPGEEPFDIEHLFIGDYKSEGEVSADGLSSVTVANVFLYNRPLDVAEPGALGLRDN